MLTAGQAVEWLRDDLGLIADRRPSPTTVAAACEDTGDVWFVPALLGLGTPAWDFGARGTLLGLTRGTGRPEVVRAVLEGVAHRGADLVEAAEADGGCSIPDAAGRRRHERQRDVRAGAGRRRPAPGRGVARAGGDDAGRRLPRRPGRRHLGRRGRRRRHLVASTTVEPARAPTAVAGGRRATGPGGGIPELSALDF